MYENTVLRTCYSQIMNVRAVWYLLYHTDCVKCQSSFTCVCVSSYQVRVYHADPHLPLVDMTLLVKSDHFIGNCVSSFTSYVKRARDVAQKPTSFWGFSWTYTRYLYSAHLHISTSRHIFTSISNDVWCKITWKCLLNPQQVLSIFFKSWSICHVTV